MSRRVRVPATDDLFRPTAVPPPEGDAVADRPPVELVEAPPVEPPVRAAVEPPPARAASGRVKHDEKVTVYVTADELLDIEAARLELRRSHALGVDRGRLVRTAVALALADLEAHGADSELVTRLRAP